MNIFIMPPSKGEKGGKGKSKDPVGPTTQSRVAGLQMIKDHCLEAATRDSDQLQIVDGVISFGVLQQSPVFMGLAKDYKCRVDIRDKLKAISDNAAAPQVMLLPLAGRVRLGKQTFACVVRLPRIASEKYSVAPDMQGGWPRLWNGRVVETIAPNQGAACRPAQVDEATWQTGLTALAGVQGELGHTAGLVLDYKSPVEFLFVENVVGRVRGRARATRCLGMVLEAFFNPGLPGPKPIPACQWCLQIAIQIMGSLMRKAFEEDGTDMGTIMQWIGVALMQSPHVLLAGTDVPRYRLARIVFPWRVFEDEEATTDNLQNTFQLYKPGVQSFQVEAEEPVHMMMTTGRPMQVTMVTPPRLTEDNRRQEYGRPSENQKYQDYRDVEMERLLYEVKELLHSTTQGADTWIVVADDRGIQNGMWNAAAASHIARAAARRQEIWRPFFFPVTESSCLAGTDPYYYATYVALALYIAICGAANLVILDSDVAITAIADVRELVNLAATMHTPVGRARKDRVLMLLSDEADGGVNTGVVIVPALTPEQQSTYDLECPKDRGSRPAAGKQCQWSYTKILHRMFRQARPSGKILRGTVEEMHRRGTQSVWNGTPLAGMHPKDSLEVLAQISLLHTMIGGIAKRDAQGQRTVFPLAAPGTVLPPAAEFARLGFDQGAYRLVATQKLAGAVIAVMPSKLLQGVITRGSKVLPPFTAEGELLASPPFFTHYAGGRKYEGMRDLPGVQRLPDFEDVMVGHEPSGTPNVLGEIGTTRTGHYLTICQEVGDSPIFQGARGQHALRLPGSRPLPARGCSTVVRVEEVLQSMPVQMKEFFLTDLIIRKAEAFQYTLASKNPPTAVPDSAEAVDTGGEGVWEEEMPQREFFTKRGRPSSDVVFNFPGLGARKPSPVHPFETITILPQPEGALGVYGQQYGASGEPYFRDGHMRPAGPQETTAWATLVSMNLPGFYDVFYDRLWRRFGVTPRQEVHESKGERATGMYNVVEVQYRPPELSYIVTMFLLFLSLQPETRIILHAVSAGSHMVMAALAALARWDEVQYGARPNVGEVLLLDPNYPPAYLDEFVKALPHVKVQVVGMVGDTLCPTLPTQVPVDTRGNLDFFLLGGDERLLKKRCGSALHGAAYLYECLGQNEWVPNFAELLDEFPARAASGYEHKRQIDITNRAVWQQIATPSERAAQSFRVVTQVVRNVSYKDEVIQGIERAAAKLRAEVWQMSPDAQGRLMQTSRRTKTALKALIMRHLKEEIWWSCLDPGPRDKLFWAMEAALDSLQQTAPNVVTLFIMAVVISSYCSDCMMDERNARATLKELPWWRGARSSSPLPVVQQFGQVVDSLKVFVQQHDNVMNAIPRIEAHFAVGTEVDCQGILQHIALYESGQIACLGQPTSRRALPWAAFQAPDGRPDVQLYPGATLYMELEPITWRRPSSRPQERLFLQIVIQEVGRLKAKKTANKGEGKGLQAEQAAQAAATVHWIDGLVVQRYGKVDMLKAYQIRNICLEPSAYSLHSVACINFDAATAYAAFMALHPGPLLREALHMAKDNSEGDEVEDYPSGDGDLEASFAYTVALKLAFLQREASAAMTALGQSGRAEQILEYASSPGPPDTELEAELEGAVRWPVQWALVLEWTSLKYAISLLANIMDPLSPAVGIAILLLADLHCGQRISLVQGPAGTGKTMGFLMLLVLYVVARGQGVVVVHAIPNAAMNAVAGFLTRFLAEHKEAAAYFCRLRPAKTAGGDTFIPCKWDTAANEYTNQTIVLGTTSKMAEFLHTHRHLKLKLAIQDEAQQGTEPVSGTTLGLIPDRVPLLLIGDPKQTPGGKVTTSQRALQDDAENARAMFYKSEEDGCDLGVYVPVTSLAERVLQGISDSQEPIDIQAIRNEMRGIAQACERTAVSATQQITCEGRAEATRQNLFLDVSTALQVLVQVDKYTVPDVTPDTSALLTMRFGAGLVLTVERRSAEPEFVFVARQVYPVTIGGRGPLPTPLLMYRQMCQDIQASILKAGGHCLFEVKRSQLLLLDDDLVAMSSTTRTKAQHRMLQDQVSCHCMMQAVKEHLVHRGEAVHTGNKMAILTTHVNSKFANRDQLDRAHRTEEEGGDRTWWEASRQKSRKKYGNSSPEQFGELVFAAPHDHVSLRREHVHALCDKAAVGQTAALTIATVRNNGEFSMNGRTGVVRSTRAERNAIVFQGGRWRQDSFIAREQTMRIIAGRGAFVPQPGTPKLEHGLLYDLLLADTRHLLGAFPKRQSALFDEEFVSLLEPEREAYPKYIAGFLCPAMRRAMAKPLLAQLRRERLQGHEAARLIAQVRQQGTCEQDMWAAGFTGERPWIAGVAIMPGTLILQWGKFYVFYELSIQGSRGTGLQLHWRRMTYVMPSPQAIPHPPNYNDIPHPPDRIDCRSDLFPAQPPLLAEDGSWERPPKISWKGKSNTILATAVNWTCTCVSDTIHWQPFLLHRLAGGSAGWELQGALLWPGQQVGQDIQEALVRIWDEGNRYCLRRPRRYEEDD